MQNTPEISETLKKNVHCVLNPTKMAWGGKAIAEKDGKLVFISGGALPGQEILVRITKNKPEFAEAKLISVQKQADYVVCNRFQATSGAPWIKVPNYTQKSWKEPEALELFHKFGGLLHNRIKNVYKGYEEPFQYWDFRHKMEWSFGPTEEILVKREQIDEKRYKNHWEHSGFGLGSKKRGQFWLVEPLKSPSGMFDEAFEQQMQAFSALCEASGKKAYNARTEKGFFRNLVARKNKKGEFLVNFITTSADDVIAQEALAFWQQRLDYKLAGFFHTVNPFQNDAQNTFESQKLLFGKDCLTENLLGLEFQISLHSFFQPNVTMAEILYTKVVQKFNDVKENETFLDLCCGTGTIGQILASNFPNNNIIGVEIVPQAIKDAQKNASRNNLPNTKWICADIKHFIKEFNTKRTKNVFNVVLDPPRAGISPKVLQKILKLPIKKLVYVSCNPATLARDAKLIETNSHLRMKSLEFVDQFAHTPHLEAIAVFEG